MKKIGFKIAMLIVIISLFNNSGFSQNDSYKISKETAFMVSQNFMPEATKGEIIGADIKSYFTINSKNSQESIHVINFSNGGFTLVSGDKRAVPVLAWSNEDEFNIDYMAPATKMWIDKYLEQLDIIENNNIQASPQVNELWKQVLTGTYVNNAKGVSRLVYTKWNQDWPYNMFTPEHPQGPNGHTYTGCVATAMAQIMKYWEYPTKGKGTISYFWGENFDIDLNLETYDYSLMPLTIKFNTTQEEKEEIAKLMLHCGVSVHMDYGYESSGSSTTLAWQAFKQNFSYRSGTQEIGKDYISDAQWKFMLKYDLDLGRPIMYRGTNDDAGGHAFICDGYQDTSFFRFNWGWGGANDGFFYLDKINPQMEFHWAQGAIFNLTPLNADYCKDNMVMVLPSYSFGDGSGPNYYNNNTHCTWFVNPEVNNFDFLRLKFEKFHLLPGDTLKIWEGNKDNGLLRLVGKYSGTYIPEEFTTLSNKFYLEFTSNEEGNAEGFEASYETVVLGITENENINFKVYPNPAFDYLFLEGIQNSEISVMDISGKVVLSSNIAGKSIDISSLKPGLYIIKTMIDNVNQYAKFIKE